MHKKRNNMIDLSYDIHIIEALKELPVPLTTFDVHKVLFDEDKRNETIFEHIANKSHHLHVVDIEKIPIILKNSNSLINDKNGKDFRTYIGKRGKQNEKLSCLKIVTKLKGDGKESVVSIYAV